MFKQYIKGDKIINATEKAYEIIYKRDGYIPYEEEVKPKRGRKKKVDQNAK